MSRSNRRERSGTSSCTAEHLLLALLDDSAAQHVLKACSANIEALRGDLTEFIDATTPLVSGEAEVDTQPTLGFQRSAARCLPCAEFRQSRGHRCERTGRHLLEQESQAVTSSRRRHIAARCGQFITHGVSKSDDDEEHDDELSASADAGDAEEGGESLAKYATNLNEEAAQGQIDPLIGRLDEVERSLRFWHDVARTIRYWSGVRCR